MEDRVEWERQSFKIENYHRGLKQCCAVECCQCRSEAKQRGHILLSLRAFVRLEAKLFGKTANRDPTKRVTPISMK